MLIREYNDAVSYTHLDVYKRQSYSHAESSVPKKARDRGVTDSVDSWMTSQTLKALQ